MVIAVLIVTPHCDVDHNSCIFKVIMSCITQSNILHNTSYSMA